MAKKFAAELPDNSLVIYDNVGHLPMEEIPQQSATDVLAFLARLGKRPPATDEVEPTARRLDEERGRP